MHSRPLAVALAGVIACFGLTSCRTNVGVAARVDGHTISESALDGYLTAEGPDAATLAQAQQSGGSVQPKTLALQFLLGEQVYAAALRSTPGGVPSDSELAKLHDEAAQRLLQAQATGSTLDAEFSQQLVKFGLKASLLKVILRQAELADAYVNREKIGSAQELTSKVAALKIPVTVNPRYGTWQATTLQLDSAPTAGLPSYLRAASASAAPAGQ
ncbi:MAG: hypothetical protein ACTHMS_20710 [Jatrophihabitans sp.]|uniref:hypothetical protein n=1 Tax=Jatrophihabitans sp. TaxID=1932789 RepID=UPI003F7EDC46